MLTKVISGGQTGVDRAGLDAADALGIEWGGWAPLGWKSEDGEIPQKYRPNMQECRVRGYRERTRRNVLDADATLILYYGEMSGGTLETYDFADGKGKPVKTHNMSDGTARGLQCMRLRLWLRNMKREAWTLNVAGPRESKCPGIQAAATALLKDVLR